MLFQLVSDLHIEYRNHELDPLDFITPSADILILAGDIGNLYLYEQLEKFMIKVCKLFKLVIYVPGNHEFYKQKNIEPINYVDLYKRMDDLKKIENLHILDKKSIIINDIVIIGCTLWTKSEIEIPHFIRVKNFNKKVYNSIHESHLKYINQMIEYSKKNNKKLLVITHHSPTYQVISHLRDEYTCFYYNDLDYLFNEDNNIHTWVYGHTHHNKDIYINKKRIVSNQLGKPVNEDKNYKKDFIIEIN